MFHFYWIQLRKDDPIQRSCLSHSTHKRFDLGLSIWKPFVDTQKTYKNYFVYDSSGYPGCVSLMFH